LSATKHMSLFQQPARTLVSVDLDDVGCYHAIHGLPPPSKPQLGIVLERCLPRFLDLFEELGVRVTFFVIGRDLWRDLEAGGRGAALLRQALANGHELANHSYGHAYDLTSWPLERIVEDLSRCDQLLRQLGANPAGFRAPGYTHDNKLLGAVASLGYRYDSSALPSPLYYAAKVSVMAWMILRGRRSHSTARGWGSFLGARRPQYMNQFGLWEIPMSVSRYLRFPLIGTLLLAGPEPLANRLRDAAAREPYFHLELHGLDLADAGGQCSSRERYAPELLRLQPELQVPLGLRLDRLRELLRRRGDAVPILSVLES
jgi:peptidoglycan/xylan/chitin deacetylase (PgdA/CDA1 family)